LILRPDAVSDFDALHDRKAQLLAFDLLELDGEDLRRDAVERLKAGLVKLLRRSDARIQLIEHLGAPGNVVFALPARLAWKASSRSAATADIANLGWQ
jgi:ATP-dependent DNA ligase